MRAAHYLMDTEFWFGKGKGSCGLNNDMDVLNDIELNITTKVDGIRVKKAKFTKDS